MAAVPCPSLLPSLESTWGIVVPWGSREAKLVFELPVCQAARHSLGLTITHLQKGIWHSDGRMVVVGHAASEQQSRGHWPLDSRVVALFPLPILPPVARV